MTLLINTQTIVSVVLAILFIIAFFVFVIIPIIYGKDLIYIYDGILEQEEQRYKKRRLFYEHIGEFKYGRANAIHPDTGEIVIINKHYKIVAHTHYYKVCYKPDKYESSEFFTCKDSYGRYYRFDNNLEKVRRIRNPFTKKNNDYISIKIKKRWHYN